MMMKNPSKLVLLTTNLASYTGSVVIWYGYIKKVTFFLLAILFTLPIGAARAQTTGQTTITVTSITIPTHVVDNALVYQTNPAYNISYARLDRGKYNAGRVENRAYTLVILENNYLKLTFLPELGGRIYQAIFKPTGHNMFYQNPVLKPSPWGPGEMGWWLAVGGMEWCLPVEEHGYEWGIPWQYKLTDLPQGAMIELWDTTAVNRLQAKIMVTLPDNAAFFQVTPTLENPTNQPIDYKFWLNAMLAPGAANQVSGSLRMVMPASQVTVHSTGDPRLPGEGGAAGWPLHNSVDWSRLGNWQQWYGFFQRPHAAGDFQAVYDEVADEGAVRVYPSAVAQGAKFFGFGYGSQALSPDLYTDDTSSYIEMHGGVAPTFDDTRRLEAHSAITWDEQWYPLAGLGGLTWGNPSMALYLAASGADTRLDVVVTRPLTDARILVVRRTTNEVLYQERLAQLLPGQPYHAPLLPTLGPDAVAVLVYQGDTLLGAYQYNGGPLVTPTAAPVISPSPVSTPTPRQTNTPPPIPTPPPAISPTPTTNPATPTFTPSPTISPSSTTTPTPTNAWQGRIRRTTPIAGWASVARIWVSGKIGAPVTIKSRHPNWKWQTTGYSGSKPEYGPDALEFAPLPPISYTLTVSDLPARFDFDLPPGVIAEIVFEQTAAQPTPAPTLTTSPTPTFTPTSSPTSTIPPSPVAPSPTIPPSATTTPTLSPTAILTPTPALTTTPTSGWRVRVPVNTTVSGNWFAVIRVSVEGQKGLPVRITIVTTDPKPWSTTCLTGSKPEYGPYFCEFAPLILGQYIISPAGLEISTTVEVKRSGVAVVIFEPY